MAEPECLPPADSAAADHEPAVAVRTSQAGTRVEVGTTHEVEKRWRVGGSVVLKVWPTYAIVLGWWGAGRTREEVVAAELDAQAVDVPVDDIRDRFRPEPGHALLPEGWKVV